MLRCNTFFCFVIPRHKPNKTPPQATMCPSCHGAVCTDTQSGLCYVARIGELFFQKRIEAPEAILTALRMYMLFDKNTKAKGGSVTNIEQKILHALAPVISVILACKMVMPCDLKTEKGLNPSPTKDDFLFECIKHRIKGCATVKDIILCSKERVREVFKICERAFLREVGYRGIIIKTEALLELQEYLCEMLGGRKVPENSVFAQVMRDIAHMAYMFSLQ